MPEAKQNKPSFLKAAALGIVIFTVMLFLITAMNTRDLLWFWPNFKEVPSAITVNCYGKEVQIAPGQTAFEAVNNAVNASMSGNKRWDSLSMSPETYQEYQTSPSVMVIELVYDPSVRLHSQYAFFKDIDRLIIPLDGRHATSNPVFGQTNGFTNSGSFHIKSNIPIKNALQEQGVCTLP